MTLVSDIRKTVTDITPVYAVVGVTDLAVEKVRDARVRAASARADLDVSDLQDKAVKRAEKVAEQVQHMPALALNQTIEAATRAQETYTVLAARGQKLITRLRTQKATQDLMAQYGSTISLGKGAVTTVRKAAVDTQRAARATLTNGRHEAAVVLESAVETVQEGLEAVVESVQDELGTAVESFQDELEETTDSVLKSADATRVSAKRAVTTARKSTSSTPRATKSGSAAKVTD